MTGRGEKDGGGAHCLMGIHASTTWNDYYHQDLTKPSQAGPHRSRAAAESAAQ